MYALVFFTGSSRAPQLGLDLRGGTTVTLTAKTPNGKAPAKEDLELARQIIEQRVNGLGVAEAEVVTEGSSNIVISVPGDNGDQARQLGQTAQLRFRPVLQVAAATPSASSSATPTPTDGGPGRPFRPPQPRRRPAAAPRRPPPPAPAPPPPLRTPRRRRRRRPRRTRRRPPRAARAPPPWPRTRRPSPRSRRPRRTRRS